MTFSDLLKSFMNCKPSRIAAVGASPEEKVILQKWEERGWKVQHFSGDLSEAITAAVKSALQGETDALFCSGADHLKISRSIERALEQVVPGEYDPLTLMQALEVPAYPKLLWVGCTPTIVYTQITAAIKSVQAMVKTLDKLNEPAPRVALLSCVEVVSPAVASTVWEATLAHMSARGQFDKAIVDGPLGFDLAISPAAVADKGVKTEVNGQADLLVPPDVNSFVTLLDAIHLTGTHQAAGIIVGGPCPIALPPHRSLRHVDTSLQVVSLLM
jgi:phosphotransacetylase